MNPDQKTRIAEQPAAQDAPEGTKFPPRTNDLSKLDLSGIVVRVKRYNEQFSMASAMTQLVVGMFEEKRREPSTPEETLLLHEAQELLSLSNLQQKIDPLLLETGLALEPVSAPWRMFGALRGGSYEGMKLRINIVDGDAFTKYLASLDSSTTPSQKEGLKTATDILVCQLVNNYNLSDASDERMIAFFRSAGSLAETCKRLEVPCDQLSHYLDAARGGCLKERLSAEKLCLHEAHAVQNYTLNWHKDCSNVDFLSTQWEKVMSTLQAIAMNPKAESLYAQASETAKIAIESAIREVGAWTVAEGGESSYYKTRKEPFLEILRSFKARLEEF